MKKIVLLCAGGMSTSILVNKMKAHAASIGKEFDIEGTELLAIALCHEIDHLSGILFTDKADELLTSEQLEERKK